LLSTLFTNSAISPYQAASRSPLSSLCVRASLMRSKPKMAGSAEYTRPDTVLVRVSSAATKRLYAALQKGLAKKGVTSGGCTGGTVSPAAAAQER